jgi:hypothetical protein
MLGKVIIGATGATGATFERFFIPCSNVLFFHFVIAFFLYHSFYKEEFYS